MRYVFAYRGVGPEPDEAAALAPAHRLKVVRNEGRHLLVEGERAGIRAFEKSLDGWVASPERTIRVPKTFRAVGV